MKITSLKFCFLLFIWFYYLKTYSQNKDTVKIGNQLWTSKNLNVTRFRNGDLIPQAKTKTEWIKAGKEKKPAWCYYNNDSVLGKKYGKLYNWFAVNDLRDLAPIGWRLPYIEDYNRLSDFCEYKGNKLKSQIVWFEVDTFGIATNNLGFNALPSGMRDYDGKYTGIKNLTIFWSLTSASRPVAESFGLNTEGIYYYYGHTFKSEGISVRLIKDDGLRKIIYQNKKLRAEIKNEMISKKYKSASYKLDIIFKSIEVKKYDDYRNLLECYVKNNEINKAEIFFNELLKTIGSESNLYNEFGWNLILSKNYLLALKYLKIASAKYPDNTYLKGNLAHAYLLSDEFEKAKKIYLENTVKTKIINESQEQFISPDGVMHLSHGPEVSVDDTTWIKMVEDDFNIFKMEGIQCENFEKILKSFNLKNENQKLRKQIYKDEFRNIDSTVFKLKKIVSNIYFIEDNDYHLLLQCYLKKNNFVSADNIFNECIQNHKVDEAIFYKLYSKDLILFNFNEQALKYLKIAIEKYPDELILKANLAHAYLLTGEIEKATKIYLENIEKRETITRQNINYDSYGGEMISSQVDWYINDTSWIKMVKEDFTYFKMGGLQSLAFDSIIKIFNLKNKNAQLRKEIDDHYDNVEDHHIIYNDTNGFLCDRNNMVYDSCIYKLKKILASNYFIEEYDYERLLDYYFGKNDLINAESFFNYCIENHKGNKVDLYNQYSNGLARFKLYQSAIKYKKLAINIQPKNPNLKIGLADLLICSGSFYEAKKIFIENIVQFDSITGDWIYEDQAHDTIWIFDTVKNIQTFDRIEYEPTSWMKKVSRWWEMDQFFCLQESNFKLIEDLMTKEHEALIRKRLELEKIKK
jgi:uncharacterized protein (TIGR02145 family)